MTATPDYLNGRTEAHEINTRLTVAYYLGADGNTTGADYHYQLAVKEFHHLAAAFGFRVEPIVAPEAINEESSRSAARCALAYLDAGMPGERV